MINTELNNDDSKDLLFLSPFGYTHPERDKREMCPYCYNEDTRRIVGLELIPYEEYYGANQFKAFECEACRAKFHFLLNVETSNP